MKIAVGFDHGGITLRETVIECLNELGHEITDFGTDGEASVDYPDYARLVAQAVVSGQCDRGVLVCGTGIGMSIAANKVRGCYAALLADAFSAAMAAQHNAANVACLGGRTIGPETARLILKTYLAATVDAAERHQNRREKVCAIERGEIG
ncbi:MAG TPA: ribose 5-phosphate isomerase B [Armatimonadetes bacterium]|jgi:ribose 5-phosphate isomerase B|nr:ribose 5-phosphate isomerase B [Armatimonadota bacterium]